MMKYPNRCPYCEADLTADDSVFVERIASTTASLSDNGGKVGVLLEPAPKVSCNACGEALKREWP